jgi:GTP-binding protein Era
MENVSLVAMSGEKGINVDKLIDVIFDIIPEGPPLYDEDIITDFPQRMAIADVIREKLFLVLKQELPYSVGVFIESMRPIKGKTLHIKALIYVERQTQKEIVIGKNGQTLKNVGSQAREDLEELVEQKVFLELFVKVNNRWRDDVSILQELGYDQIS